MSNGHPLTGRATHEQSQQAVSADPVGIPDAWTPAALTVPYGSGDTMKGSVTIVGWRSAKWFLDYRADDDKWGGVQDGWALTHAPTGWFCCFIKGPLLFAQALAFEVENWGDWHDELTPMQIREAFKPSALAFKEKHGGTVTFGLVPAYSQITHEASLAERQQ